MSEEGRVEREWKLGEDLFLEDSLLDGITFGEVVTTVKCNARIINRAAVRTALKEILEIRMQDYEYILEKNIDEIVREAKKAREGG